MKNNKNKLKELLQTYNSVEVVEKILAFEFIKANRIEVSRSSFLSEYFDGFDFPSDSIINSFSTGNPCSFEDLIEFFELLVSSDQKKEKGVVYTPSVIREYIISETINSHLLPTVLDPACGCGAFLITAAQQIYHRSNKSYREIIADYIFGIDIDSDAIRKTHLLLELLACVNSEYTDGKVNLFCANSLQKQTITSIKKEYPLGFDCIVGNPPYVRNRNISSMDKLFLKNWNSSIKGNADLYMPFFEVGLSLVSSTGKIGYITPNGYLQSINGRNLRNILLDCNGGIRILDFRDMQIFKGVTSYTCITIIDLAVSTEKIQYVRLNEDQTLVSHQYSVYDKKTIKKDASWRMNRNDIDKVIYRLENSGNPLSNWSIRNGLATLKNDLFFFSPTKEDKDFYYRHYQGKEYKIEKPLCIDVAKPNIIKCEEDLLSKTEKAIFPYYYLDNKPVIISEDQLSINYPYAYSFLSDFKKELKQRDKGKGTYPAWYAYGRTQGMNNFGKKLLIPYISGDPVAVLSLKEDLLFYCGYGLFSNDVQELNVLKRFLESDAFWYYIFHTSKPYSKGYMAFAKNYLVKFNIPELTKEEKDYLLNEKDNIKLNNWIWSKYELTPQPLS